MKLRISHLVILGGSILALSLSSCKDTDQGPKLVFKFKFDSTQVRLNNIGQPAVMPSDHRAQNPLFNQMSAHYIELAPTAFTALGTGEVLYVAPETNAGGDKAIDFNKSVKAAEGEVFFSIPLSEIQAGTYEWIRVSLAYQNFDIRYKVGPPAVPLEYEGVGTLASFIGYNTYIQSFNINTTSMDVNDDKKQGFWAFETVIPGIPAQVASGQAPEGATTVPNPLFSSSPIPSGSCVVTGPFSGNGLVITGQETEDIVVVLSVSTNQSFEWLETGNNNLYEPLNGDVVVDMGVRGLIPIIE